MQIIRKSAAETFGLLDTCPGDSLWPVLNMLNTKYLILPTNEGARVSVANPWANGNAWFVDSLTYVEDADAEIAALHGLDTRHEAVADVRFREILGEAIPVDSTASVVLDSYEANRLAYEVSSDKGGILVFSDIYYPGWACEIDGKPVGLGRVNYVLRAVAMPAGKHQVVMSFDPQSVHVTETIANTSLALLAITIVALLVSVIRKVRKKEGAGQ